jgi:hypothetical protein
MLLRPMWRISHLLSDGPLLGAVARPHHAVVNDVENVEIQVSQVVVHTRGKLLRRDGRLPRLVGRAPCPQLGDDHQVFRIRMERLLDYLVGDVRTVVVAGIDVVHACHDGLAKDGDGAVRVLGRSPYAGGQPVALRRSPCGLQSTKSFRT